MRKRKTWAQICIVLCICLLASLVSFCFANGDLSYRLWTKIRPYQSLNLQQTTLSETRVYSWDELQTQHNVTVSNLMMLVNHDHPLPTDYEAILEEYNGAVMHPDMIAPYVALRDRIQRETGMRIYVSSDFRTSEEQENILSESGDGVAAEVGCSEHEAGLALDVYVAYFAGDSFLKSAAGRRVNTICSEYGFVIRYPLDKEGVTYITYEPWHLRYVGEPHARLMTEAGLTLEEYLDSLTPNTWYESGDYLLCRQAGDAITLPTEYTSCEISSDNTGYCLITVKK